MIEMLKVRTRELSYDPAKTGIPGTVPKDPMSAPSETPHHLGHRQRLRQRFLDGGAEALPDYELLELLLFLAIPRQGRQTARQEAAGPASAASRRC